MTMPKNEEIPLNISLQIKYGTTAFSGRKTNLTSHDL